MFEIKSTDLAGRIGLLQTKSGTIETPCILPVIHPVRQILSPKQIAKIGFKAVMTNAYITLKKYGEKAEKKGIHKIIDYDGVIMTDSGGYQMLRYGDIDFLPSDVAKFQQKIGSDIAIVLDTPTGINVDRKRAIETVEITLKSAKETLDAVNSEGTLWVGPIQGGIYLDLLKESAEKTGKMPFNIFALGSPTEVMESYKFNLLAQMIITVKKHLPIDKPLHLFGAGHPLTIPLIVAMGCDLFDSASYILYAKKNRYLTAYGTKTLENLTYLPCVCPLCSKYTAKEIRNLEIEERIKALSIHNLYILLKEVNSTKLAIKEGRLWEYLSIKARAHPKLWEAFKLLKSHVEFLEDGTPLFKSKAIFFFEPYDIIRPEVIRFKQRILENISIKKKSLLLLPESNIKPFSKSPVYNKLNNKFNQELKEIQICFISLPFGIVPVELSDIYPLSQYVSSLEVNDSVISFILPFLKEFIKTNNFKKIIILNYLEEYYALIKIISENIKSCYVINVQSNTKEGISKGFDELSHIIKTQV